MAWTTGAGAGVARALRRERRVPPAPLGDVGGDGFRDDEGPARVDPVGVGERSATGLGYADVGLVDGLPLLAVAVVRDGDAPQGVTGHHGVGHRGGLCIQRWSGVGHELHRGSNSSACDAGRCGGGGGEGRGDGGGGGADAPSWHSAELAEDDGGRDDSGDECGRGAVAPEWDAPIPIATTDMGHCGGGDGEGEIGPGQPRQRREELGPERARDRRAQRAGDLATAGEMVREGPADGDGQDGRDPDEPAQQAQ